MENTLSPMKTLSLNLFKLIETDFGNHFVTHQDGAENPNQLEFRDSALHQDGAEKNGLRDGENNQKLQLSILLARRTQISPILKDISSNKKKFMDFGEES